MNSYMNTTDQKDCKLLTILNVMMDIRVNLNVLKHSAGFPEKASKAQTFFVRQASENPYHMV